MHHRIILGLFLISGHLVAMGPGVWDEHGNYLGPAVPPQTRFVHVPVPVPMMQMMPPYMYPMFGNPMGFPMGYPPYSMQPPLQSMMPQFLPPSFGLPNVYQQPVQNSQWAAPAAAVQEQHQAQFPQQQPLVVEPTVSQRPTDDDDNDAEVVRITNRMQVIQIDEAAQVTPPRSASPLIRSSRTSPRPATLVAQSSQVSWADEQEDGDISLPAGWVRHDQSTQSSSASTSAQSCEVQPSEPAVPMVQSAPAVDLAHAKKDSPRVHHTEVSASETKNSQSHINPHDEKLYAAMSNYKNMHTILSHLRRKIGWLTEKCTGKQAAAECAQLAERIQLDLNKSRPASQHAESLLGFADKCIKRKKQENSDDAKRGFAQLATQLIGVAEHGQLTDDQKTRIQRQLSSISRPKTTVVDQTDISEEEFYQGYTVTDAQTVVRSDGRVLHAVFGAQDDSKKKAAAPVAPKKNKTQGAQAASSAKSDDKVVVVTEEKPAQAQSSHDAAPVPQDNKIREILAKGKVDKNIISFLQKVVEKDGQIEDPALKAQVLLELGVHYAGGCACSSVHKDHKKVKEYIGRAHAGGSKNAVYYLMEFAYQDGDMPEVISFCDSVYSDDTAPESGKDIASVYGAIARLHGDTGKVEWGNALEVFKKIELRHSWSHSMKEFIDALPEQFYVTMRSNLAGWQSKIKEKEADTNQAENVSRVQMLDWFYLMGRMHLEGGLKTKDHKYDAIEWLKAAAGAGHVSACLYIARSSETSSMSVYERLNYLAHVMVASESRKLLQEDQAEAWRVCEKYAFEGHVMPLAYCLMLVHKKQAQNSSRACLDDMLAKLRNNFPSIDLDRLPVAAYDMVKTSGLFDALAQRAQTDWAARAVLAAFQIVRSNDLLENDFSNVQESLERVRSALQTIEPDMESHPEIRTIVSGGYLRLATGSVGIKASHADLEAYYMKAIQMGHIVANQRFAILALAQRKVGDAQKSEQEKALNILEKIIEYSPEHRFSAYENLISYYQRHAEWNKVFEYIERAKECGHAMHKDLSGLALCEANAKAEREKQRKQARNRIRQRFAAPQETGQAVTWTTKAAPAASNNLKVVGQATLKLTQDLCDTMQAAHKDILQAMNAVINDVPAAVEFLDSARKKGVGAILPENPELALLYAFVIADAVKDACDESSDPALLDQEMKKLEEHLSLIDHAISASLPKMSELSKRMRPQAYKCLMLYWQLRSMWQLRNQPVDKQVDGTKLIFSNFKNTAKNVLAELETIEPRNVYVVALESLNINLANARMEYMKATQGQELQLYVPFTL